MVILLESKFLFLDEYMVVFDFCMVVFIIDFMKKIVKEFNLIVMMVIYLMKDVLVCGDCIVMLY